jgi:acyl-CoA reductase-like NAD-dependent aldehyde dehydrogenase
MLDRPTTQQAWQERAKALTIETRAFIDGAFVPAISGATFDRISPVDGTVLAKIANCDSADVDMAVSAARKAFEDGRWRHLAPVEKKRVLLKFSALIREHIDDIALLESLDVGKVIGNALAVDVPFCADCIQYYGELADKLYDEVAPTGPMDLAVIRKEPLGVVAAIVPWNYPLIIAAWKIGPALVAGNSCWRDSRRKRAFRMECLMSLPALVPAQANPLRCIRMSTW